MDVLIASCEARFIMATERQTGTAPAAPEQRKTNLLNETVVELKKTHWPTSQEAWRLTYVVLAVILVLGTYMGTLDYLLTMVVSKFSLIK